MFVNSIGIGITCKVCFVGIIEFISSENIKCDGVREKGSYLHLIKIELMASPVS